MLCFPHVAMKSWRPSAGVSLDSLPGLRSTYFLNDFWAVCRSVSRSTTQPEKPTENHLTYLDKFLQSRRGTEEYVRPSFLLSPLLRVRTPRVHFCGEEGFRAGVPTSSSRALQHQRGWSTRLLLTVSPGDTPFSCKARPGGWPYHGQDGYASPPKITHGTGATPTPGQL